MTEELEKVFRKAARLPESEQDALAAVLHEEMASERRWAASFGRSREMLEALADSALADLHTGNTVPLDPDSL